MLRLVIVVAVAVVAVVEDGGSAVAVTPSVGVAVVSLLVLLQA